MYPCIVCPSPSARLVRDDHLARLTTLTTFRGRILKLSGACTSYGRWDGFTSEFCMDLICHSIGLEESTAPWTDTANRR